MCKMRFIPRVVSCAKKKTDLNYLALIHESSYQPHSCDMLAQGSFFLECIEKAKVYVNIPHVAF